MKEKTESLLELYLLGGVIFYIIFKGITLITMFFQNDLLAIILGALIAGLFTGYELRNKKFKNIEILLSSISSVVLFVFIRIIFSMIFSMSLNLSMLYSWIIIGLMCLPVFFVGEFVLYKILRRKNIT
jgi:hypothetical protein